jgi:hypothetical protein
MVNLQIYFLINQLKINMILLFAIFITFSSLMLFSNLILLMIFSSAYASAISLFVEFQSICLNYLSPDHENASIVSIALLII